jgi:[ribosomal protein S18]-alanine N-acetyltransferase
MSTSDPSTPNVPAAAAATPAKPARDKRFVSLLWATIDHAEALATCHASLFPDAWNADSFRQMLSHPGSATLVARYGVEQELVGFIVGQLAADEAEILTFGVAKDWQRHGIGMRLLEGLQRAASRGEAKKLFLEVGEDNLPALVLYSRVGFKEAGRRKGYYKRPDGAAVDALNLVLPLSPA